jgi:Flp pilus assembly pilin Flp
MIDRLRQAWTEDDGVLSFEWTLLVTLLVLGVVGGLTAARDAILSELGDVAQAMLAVDNSYTIDFPLELAVSLDGEAPQAIGKAAASGFSDSAARFDGGRTTAPSGQTQ